MMTKLEIDELIADFSASATVTADPDLHLVETVLFVEECFGIQVEDSDFSNEKLGTSEALNAFVKNRLGA